MNAIFTSRFLQVENFTGTQIYRSVRSFFGIRPLATFKGSRIVRRPQRTYEEFIFRGYHVEKVGPANAASFKAFRTLWKN